MKQQLTILFLTSCVMSSIISCTDNEDLEFSTENNEQQIYLCYKPKGEVEEIQISNGSYIYLDLADSTYFYGDVLFSKEQVVAMTLPQTRSAAIKSKVSYWPNKKISYILDKNFSERDKQTIKLAMQNIGKHTGIQFTEIVKPTTYYLNFKLSDSNSSSIGMQKKGNNINFAENQMIGVYMHEIMHSLGYFHEHTRSDRDLYVNLLTQNIQNGKQHNFNKYNTKYEGYDIGAFDMQSIMMYGSTAFANPNTYTITNKNGGGYIYANRSKLSDGDILGLQFIYGPEKLVVKTYTEDEVTNGDNTYATFGNTVYFEDENGNLITLSHPRLLVIDYSTSRYNDLDPNNYSYSNNTYYYIAKEGESSYELGSTYLSHEEEGYGIVRDHSLSYYSIFQY